jgi:hypothetical protein
MEDDIVPEKMMTKRDGSLQALSLTKINARLENLLTGLADKHINLGLISNKVF